MSGCGHICTNLGIPKAREVEEKEELKNLLNWRKFPSYVMVDGEVFTYLKNNKELILIVQYLRFLNGTIHLLKKRLYYRCLPVNFAKFLRTTFLYRAHLVAASRFVR